MKKRGVLYSSKKAQSVFSDKLTDGLLWLIVLFALAAAIYFGIKSLTSF